MNKLFLIGNLTKNPDLNETKSGKKVCRFTLAVNRPMANSDGERETDFFNVSVWGVLAENIAKYQKKGMKVAVTGSVQLRTYEDNNGNKHQTVDVIAQDVEFLSPKTETKKENNNAFESIDDEDAPF